MFVNDFMRFTRAHEWHPGKMPLMLAFVSIMFLFSPSPQQNFLWVILAYVLTSLYLAASYMLNNIADREIDKVANKKTGLDGWSRKKLAIPVVIFAALILLFGIAFLSIPVVIAILGCFILSWSYHMPPRYKEHVILGPIVPAFAQLPAPALVVAVAWGNLPLPALVYLMIMFFYLVRMLFVHHILDYENDKLTGTNTTATKLGVPAVLRLVRFTFVIEMLCLVVFLALIVHYGFPKLLFISLAWPLCLLILRHIRKEPIRLDSYSYIPLADIHESVLPLILAIGVAMREGNMMIAIVPLVIVLFLRRHFERLVVPLLGWK